MLITFGAVLAVGVETGILVGVTSAILLFIWRTSRPHMAIVGRVGAEVLIQELRDAGVEFHMVDIKGPVLDRLKKIGFVDYFGESHIHLSVHDAMKVLECL